MAKRYIVVGAAVAGSAAAATIRRQDPNAEIVVLGREPLPLYSRIRLPDYLAGNVTRDRLIIRPTDWYRERDIELRLNTVVDGLDPAAGTVHCHGGETLAYDACLLATGARPYVPPLPGCTLDRVFGIHSTADVDRCRSLAAPNGRLVTIGGGVLGVEMAFSALTLGMSAHVLEREPWLLPLQLDREAAGLLQRLLEARGLSFHVGARVTAVEGHEYATAVRLADGEILPADIILVAAGIRAETSLARDAGVTVGSGIAVDRRLATSVAGIYAAGDCAEYPGSAIGIWPAADKQGRAAGMAMTGGRVDYRGTAPTYRLKVTGIDVFSAGAVDAGDDCYCDFEHGEASYRKLVRRRDGRLIGAIMVEDLRGWRDVLREIESNRLAEACAAP